MARLGLCITSIYPLAWDLQGPRIIPSYTLALVAYQGSTNFSKNLSASDSFSRWQISILGKIFFTSKIVFELKQLALTGT
jgi:hypothetical protein